MKKYIGTKMIEAEKAFKVGDVIYSNENNEIDAYMLAEGEVAQMGYKVRYPDGYESFSPKAVFEKAYLPLEVNKKLKTDALSISQKMVDDFISHYETKTLGNKTTVVRAVLVNGFEIVESSSCVSEENYDESMGYEICVKKIKEKVWYLLGFLLQTAVYGIGGNEEAEDAVTEVFAEKARDLEEEYEEQVEQEKACEECAGCCDECSGVEESDNADGVSIHMYDREESVWASVVIDEKDCHIRGNCEYLTSVIFDALTKEMESEEEFQCSGNCHKE